MKSTIIALIIFLSFSLAAQDGWQILFNGKDFSGWEKRNGEAGYRIENGELIGTTKAGTPNTFLCTKETYYNFILELEVKVDPAMNSGIQFRSNSLPDYHNGRVHGYQAEIDPSPRAFSGGVYDEQRRGWLYPLNENEAGQKAFKNGDWNLYRIEAVGHEIRIWVNGVNTANLVDDWTAGGFIGLQVHSISSAEEAGREIRWRNIRIKTQGLEVERQPMQPETPEVNLIPNTLTDYELRKGWRLLFDGQDTDGWRRPLSKDFPKKSWILENGTLTTQDAAGGEVLMSEERFSNFELKLEFKMAKGAKGGIVYFSPKESDAAEATGLKFALADDAGLSPNSSQSPGSLFGLIPASNLSVPSREKEFRGIDEWNEVRIVARGRQVEHWLNGFRVMEYERGTPGFRALLACSLGNIPAGFGDWPEGHILLCNDNGRLSFRSIKIREF